MEEERDIVVFSDDDGNEIEMEVVDYFDYEEQEYAILIDPNAAEGEEESEADAETEVYIMKVVVDGDMEEFLPADEDMLDVLSEIVEARLACDEESCEGCEGCGAKQDD